MGEEAVRSSERDFPVFTILVPVNVRFAVILMKTHWNYFFGKSRGEMDTTGAFNFVFM